eukprot:scaffold3586_cov404-Prasinococcus_capsulatus_cf.AAC.20
MQKYLAPQREVLICVAEHQLDLARGRLLYLCVSSPGSLSRALTHRHGTVAALLTPLTYMFSGTSGIPHDHHHHRPAPETCYHSTQLCPSHQAGLIERSVSGKDPPLVWA